MLRKLLICWFARYESNFAVVPSVRVQISADRRYRVPDLTFCQRPLSRVAVLTTTPLAVIDVLSPDDRMKDMLERFADYSRIGVHSIVLMDPERLVAHKYESGSLIQTAFETLPLPGENSVPFVSASLFRELTEALGEAS